MRKKRVLLVSANRFELPYPVYPIGLSFIATYLKKRLPNFEIRIFDFITDDIAAFSNTLKEFSPDYIGISIRNIDDVNFYSRVSFVSGYAKIVELARENSRAKIILGGAGFSIFPKEILELLSVDFGIAGEGEHSLYSLLSALETGKDFSDIDGLLYKKNNTIISNDKAVKKTQLDLELAFDNALTDYYWENSGMLSIQTKRGCPKKCIYCTYPLIEGQRVRTISPDNVVATLEHLFFNKGIDYIFITDSIFNIDNAYNYELAKKIIESGIKIKWGAYFAPHNLDEQLMTLLKESGLTHIEFGTDSISDTQLKNYNKNFTVSDVIEASELCNRVGINFAHFLILGEYGETEQTLSETFENSERIEKSVFFPFIGMRIYPGTELDTLINGTTLDKNKSLADPQYFLSNNIDPIKIKEAANKSSKRWVFPEEDTTAIMKRMRKKGIKGPLWEFMIR